MFRFWLPVIAVVFSIACFSDAALQCVVAQNNSEAAAAKAYEEINSEFQGAVKELRQLVAKAESKDKQAELLATKNPTPVFAEKFMALAEKYPDTKIAVKCVLFNVGQTSGAQKDKAISLLIEKYSNKINLAKVSESFIKEVPRQQIEDWFDQMIANASSGDIKAKVIVNYSQYLGQLPYFRRTIELNPAVTARLQPGQLDYINADRTEEQDKRQAELLQLVIDKHADVKFKGRKTCAEYAKSELFELTRLQVGMVAPEIEGNDLDDIPFKLSDYRGKVVMLDFWGHWCPPCRAMYGHEQDITRKLADKPFVLLGVNSDGDKEEARNAVASENLSWRHFWNGPKGTRGPISTEWNVETSGWPTVYLIDGNGVIRYKEVLGDDIDRGLEVLMKEAGHEIDIAASE
ncbi:MAG: peroxiredoxin family protein [Mariniblastus sp.]